MIIRSNETKNSAMTPCCDGIGATYFERFLDGDELPKNLNFVSRLKIEKGNSIGLHRHEGEVEFYYILKGEGLVQDDDFSTTVYEGDLTMTDNMHRHSIANQKDEVLEILAFIVKA